MPRPPCTSGPTNENSSLLFTPRKWPSVSLRTLDSESPLLSYRGERLCHALVLMGGRSARMKIWRHREPHCKTLWPKLSQICSAILSRSPVTTCACAFQFPVVVYPGYRCSWDSAASSPMCSWHRVYRKTRLDESMLLWDPVVAEPTNASASIASSRHRCIHSGRVGLISVLTSLVGHRERQAWRSPRTI